MDNRNDYIELLLRDGRYLAQLNEFSDDFEMVAAAVLGRDYGGAHVLRYASSRLQNNEIILDLVQEENEIQDLKKRVEESILDDREKKDLIDRLMNARIALIKKKHREYLVSQKAEDEIQEDEIQEDYTVSEKLKEIMDKALIGTQYNHPNSNIASNISKQLYNILKTEYVYGIREDYNDESMDILNYISRNSSIYGINLRENVYDYYQNNSDYKLCTSRGLSSGILGMKGVPHNDIFSIDLLKLGLNCDNVDPKLKDKIKKFLGYLEERMIDISVPDRNKGLGNEDFFNSLITEDDIYSLVQTYYNSLDFSDVYNNQNIEIEEITDTARDVLSNIDSVSLKDSYHGVLLNGNIKVASDKGYVSRPNSVQMDAVGSLVRDKNHYINIVADGVGGTYEGGKASRLLVDELINFYNNLDDYTVGNVDYLRSKLEEKIREINDTIYDRFNSYGYTNAQTTFVLSVTAGDETLIMNVGDSTAYAYDENLDMLDELSTLDSYSRGLSYEGARYNPDNNRLTAAVGVPNYNSFTIHSSVIKNNGQRIILSSDGVTDLISEDNFKSYFRNKDVTTQEIIDKAKYNPDYNPYKREDNISVIVVDLPENEKTIERGR